MGFFLPRQKPYKASLIPSNAFLTHNVFECHKSCQFKVPQGSEGFQSVLCTENQISLVLLPDYSCLDIPSLNIPESSMKWLVPLAFEGTTGKSSII